MGLFGNLIKGLTGMGKKPGYIVPRSQVPSLSDLILGHVEECHSEKAKDALMRVSAQLAGGTPTASLIAPLITEARANPADASTIISAVVCLEDYEERLANTRP